MNIGINYIYDIEFYDSNGKERDMIGVSFKAPVSVGDAIKWLGCLLVVEQVTHDIHGSSPALMCKFIPAKEG